MTKYRELTAPEIAALEAAGNSAEAWEKISVTEDFDPVQLRGSRFGGEVTVGSGARVYCSTVRNYRLERDVLVDSVTALECRAESAFGNGVPAAAMNECGGRTVRIYDGLTAQIAYVAAVYRHRPQTQERIERMVGLHAAARRDRIGTVGEGSRIVGCRFVREVRVGARTVIEGASLLENGTIADDVVVGADVQARDFIIAEGAVVAGGAIMERCFVGECCRMDKRFTAVDSLFFANSHCENGEAASVFAGPHTVSHHKSSLLIAGMFSFFNAGSGTNQSNHLFKSGAVHQAVHLRGCKFSSNAYVMAPAFEGAFTMILGRHSAHHDTSAFPFSYLIERDGRSMLMPAANLTSYGTVRDMEKWPARDRRRLRRDVVNYEACNPYLAGAMIRAVNTLNALAERQPDAESYVYNKTVIRSVQLKRGITLYNKAIVASIGAMLAAGEADPACDGRGRWIDLGGQFITASAVADALDAFDGGRIDSLDGLAERFRTFAGRYAAYARSWAEGVLGQLLGHAPSAVEIAEAVTAGENVRAAMRRASDQDRAKDCSMEMAVSYGLDADEGDEATRRADYCAVRGLNM